MLIDCFGKSIEIKDYDIEDRKYIDCVVRNKRILLLPEEKVRQAILLLLINYTELNLDNFDFKVEHNNLDIAIYHKNKLATFQPTCSPLLIIEVKRKDENLAKHEFQILNYLELNSCIDGILTNGQQTYLYSIKHQYKRRSFDIFLLNDYFDKCKADDDIKYFESATEGDLESFLFLIHRYGQTCKLKFLCTNFETPIDTFLVSQVNQFIVFDFCGLAKKKQTKINKNNFVRLISIS